MLGVVRVFSRKSTIILADVNAIMHAIKRYKLQQSNRATGKKRARDNLSMTSADNHQGISLKKGEDTARFDLITLPLGKKKTSGTATGLTRTSDVPSRSAGTVSRGKPSQSSLLPHDLSLADGGELDVLAAMETVFPTVLVPRTGVDIASGLSSPSSGIKSETQKRILYSARDQDITLTAPDRNNEYNDFGMLEEDLQFNLLSDSLPNDSNSGVLFVSQNPGVAPLPDGSQSGDRLSPVAQLGEPLGIEPLDLEPLHFGTPSAAESSRERVSEPLQGGTMAKSASKSARQEGTKSIPEPKTKVTESPAENSEVKKTPEKVDDQNTSSRGVKPLSTGRKRKSPGVRDDKVTELPPSEIRRCLNDTTDIVIDCPGDRLINKKARRVSEDSITLAVPTFLQSFAKDITDVWEEVTVQPLRFIEGLKEAESSKNKRQKRVDGDPITTKPPRAARSPVQILFQDEEEQALPVNSFDEPQAVDRRDSSVEFERTREAPAGGSRGELSIPSGSLDGKNQSGGPTVSDNDSKAVFEDQLDKVRHRL